MFRIILSKLYDKWLPVDWQPLSLGMNNVAVDIHQAAKTVQVKSSVTCALK